MKSLWIIVLLVAVFPSYSPAQGIDDLRANIGEVKDTRTTGQFFGGLEIELNVICANLNDAKAFRFAVTSARDDQGTDLVKKEEDSFNSNEFTELDEYNLDNGQAKLTVNLRNPLRKAMYVKELTGDLEMFIPKYDEEAVLTFNKFQEQSGAPLKSEKLDKAGIAITVMTKEQYDKAAQADETKESKPEENVGEALGKAFSEAFSSMFGMMGTVSEGSIILNIKDTESRLMGIVFIGADGAIINSMGRTTMGETSVYDFETPLPPDAGIRFFLSTEKALIKLPLQLKDIALP